MTRESKKVVKNLKQQSVLYQNNLHELFRTKMPVIGFLVSMKNHKLRSVVPKLFSSSLCFNTSSKMSHCVVKLPQKIPRENGYKTSKSLELSVFSSYKLVRKQNFKSLILITYISILAYAYFLIYFLKYDDQSFTD